MRTNRLDSELHCFAILQYRKGWSLTMAMRVYCSYKARCKGGTPNALENGDPCVWNPTGYHSIFWQVPLQLKIIHRLIPGYEHYSVSLRASICDAGISNEILVPSKAKQCKRIPIRSQTDDSRPKSLPDRKSLEEDDQISSLDKAETISIKSDTSGQNADVTKIGFLWFPSFQTHAFVSLTY